jgi:hypothetical protein
MQSWPGTRPGHPRLAFSRVIKKAVDARDERGHDGVSDWTDRQVQLPVPDFIIPATSAMRTSSERLAAFILVITLAR